MEIAIGIFDSTERAEQAVKDLRQNQIPGQAIIFLTGSENEAMSFTKELGTYVGGVMGGAVQFTAGQIGSALALVPGFGQVYAIGLGAAALLHYLGSKVGATAVKRSLEGAHQQIALGCVIVDDTQAAVATVVLRPEILTHLGIGDFLSGAFVSALADMKRSCV